MKITSVEIASAPIGVLGKRLKTLFKKSFELDWPESKRFPDDNWMKSLLEVIAEYGYVIRITEFENSPYHFCRLTNLESGLRFNIWGISAREAALRACGLAALHHWQMSLASSA